MSKFLTFSLFTLTFYFAVALQATATPSYWAAAYTAAYEGDTSSGANVGDYTGYYCTVESAASMFGGNNTVESVTTYLYSNYSAGLAALKANASVDAGVSAVGQLTVRDYENGQYGLKTTYGDALVGSAFLAVLLYNADSADGAAFRVMANDPETMQTLGSALFSDNALASSGTVGEWTTVPEPTSGLLLLLGFAGLALKRKRV